MNFVNLVQPESVPFAVNLERIESIEAERVFEYFPDGIVVRMVIQMTSGKPWVVMWPMTVPRPVPSREMTYRVEAVTQFMSHLLNILDPEKERS